MINMLLKYMDKNVIICDENRYNSWLCMGTVAFTIQEYSGGISLNSLDTE